MSGEPGSKKYFEETWFELTLLTGYFALAWLLFQWLMPPVAMSTDAIQDVAMGKLFAEGRIIDAFLHFNQPPGYPMLLALLMHAIHGNDLYRLTDAALALNLGLYMTSIALVYAFIRRQIRKPYGFIITGLYVLAPATLNLAWTLGPGMAYLTFSMAALVAVDRVMSRETAESGHISRGALALCGALMGLAILVQPVGYLLLLAFFFIMLKRCGLKKSALSLSVMLLCISPFVGRDLYTALRRPDSYMAPSANLVETARRQGLFKTLRLAADEALANLTRHAVGELNLAALEQRTLGVNPPDHADRIGVWNLPWGRWILGILAILGTLYGLYLYTGVGSLYLSAYLLAALILLPGGQLSLAMVSPLILFSLYFGVMRFGEWMKTLHLPISKIVSPALTMWILLCTFTNHLAGGNPEAARAQLAEPEPKVVYMSTIKKPESRLEDAKIGSARRRAKQWLENNTPRDARVAIPRPEAAALLARQGESADAEGRLQAGAIRQELANYDYLVEEAATDLSPIQPGAAQPRGLKLVYEDRPGKIRIWQIQPVSH